MLSVIFLTICIVISFIALFIAGIITIVSKIRKTGKSKLPLIFTILFSLLFFGLIGLDVYVIGQKAKKIANDVIENKENNLQDKVLKAAELTGKGYVATYDGILKHWDERALENLKNIEIFVLDTKIEEIEDIKKYSITIIFNNKNEKISDSNSFITLSTGQYIMVVDKDDFVFPLTNTMDESVIPLGKSKVIFFAEVDRDVELKYVRFIDQKEDLF